MFSFLISYFVILLSCIVFYILNLFYLKNWIVLGWPLAKFFEVSILWIFASVLYVWFFLSGKFGFLGKQLEDRYLKSGFWSLMIYTQHFSLKFLESSIGGFDQCSWFFLTIVKVFHLSLFYERRLFFYLKCALQCRIKFSILIKPLT